jgi:hypothetical protein
MPEHVNTFVDEADIKEQQKTINEGRKVTLDLLRMIEHRQHEHDEKVRTFYNSTNTQKP